MASGDLVNVRFHDHPLRRLKIFSCIMILTSLAVCASIIGLGLHKKVILFDASRFFGDQNISFDEIPLCVAPWRPKSCYHFEAFKQAVYDGAGIAVKVLRSEYKNELIPPMKKSCTMATIFYLFFLVSGISLFISIPLTIFFVTRAKTIVDLKDLEKVRMIQEGGIDASNLTSSSKSYIEPNRIQSKFVQIFLSLGLISMWLAVFAFLTLNLFFPTSMRPKEIGFMSLFGAVVLFMSVIQVKFHPVLTRYRRGEYHEEAEEMVDDLHFKHLIKKAKKDPDHINRISQGGMIIPEEFSKETKEKLSQVPNFFTASKDKSGRKSNVTRKSVAILDPRVPRQSVAADGRANARRSVAFSDVSKASPEAEGMVLAEVGSAAHFQERMTHMLSIQLMRKERQSNARMEWAERKSHRPHFDDQTYSGEQKQTELRDIHHDKKMQDDDDGHSISSNKVRRGGILATPPSALKRNVRPPARSPIMHTEQQEPHMGGHAINNNAMYGLGANGFSDLQGDNNGLMGGWSHYSLYPQMVSNSIEEGENLRQPFTRTNNYQ